MSHPFVLSSREDKIVVETYVTMPRALTLYLSNLANNQLRSSTARSLLISVLVATILTLPGVARAQSIAIDPDPLDFGSSLVGATNAGSFNIEETGGVNDLVVDSIVKDAANTDCDSFTITLPTFPLTVPAGMLAMIDVTYDPQNAAAHSCQVTITSNDGGVPGSTTTMDLIGIGQEPQLQVDPVSVDFGQRDVGSMTTRQITVSNSNAATASTLTIDSFTLSGNAAFSFNDPGMQVLLPGDSVSFDVVFSPTASGSVSAILTIESDDPDDDPFDIPLDGIGMDPAVITVDPTSLAFGTLRVGSPSALTFDISNADGNFRRDLDVSSILVTSGGSDYAVDTASAIIAPGDSITVTTTFTPSARGLRNGTVTISSNDGGSPDTVSLSGTGTEPDIDVLTPVGLSLDFGTVGQTQASPAQVVTVENDGNEDLVISAVSLDNLTDYSVSGPSNVTLAPGNNATWDIQCTPLGCRHLGGQFHYRQQRSRRRSSDHLAGLRGHRRHSQRGSGG